MKSMRNYLVRKVLQIKLKVLQIKVAVSKRSTQLVFNESGDGWVDVLLKILVAIAIFGSIMAILSIAVPDLGKLIVDKLKEQFNK